MKPRQVLQPKQTYKVSFRKHSVWLIDNAGGNCYGAFLATRSETITAKD